MAVRLSLVALVVSLAVPLALAQPGTLDPAFGADGTGGTLTLAPGENNRVFTLALADDGRVLLGGRRNGRAVVARLFADGPVDTGWGVQGIAELPVVGEEARVTALHVYPDGRVLAAYAYGVGQTFPNRAGFVRLDVFGQPDATFGTNGVVAVDPALYRASGFPAIGVLADGSIQGVADVFSEAIGGSGLFGVRLGDDGAFDTSYGDGGYVFILESENFAVVYGGLVFEDGSAYLVGSQPPFAYVARLDADGALDPSFGSVGDTTVVVPDPDTFPAFQDVALDAQGRLVLAGANDGFVDNDLFAARLLPSGAPDPSFGTGGVVVPALAQSETGAYGVAVQDDGRILLAAEFGDESAQALSAVRLDADGQLDATFGSGGVATAAFDGFPGSRARALALRPTGEVLVAGWVETPNSAGSPVAVGFAAAQFLTATGTAGEADAARGVALAAWPNPASASLTVTVELDAPADGAVLLSDVLGREVAVLHRGRLAGGRHAYAVDARSLAPGVYVVRARVGGEVWSSVLTIVR